MPWCGSNNTNGNNDPFDPDSWQWLLNSEVPCSEDSGIAHILFLVLQGSKSQFVDGFPPLFYGVAINMAVSH